MPKAKVSAFIFGLLMIAGCSEYGYRYQPHPQEWANPVFADYRVKGDEVDILVDTNGFRLQQASIYKLDGTYAKPTGMTYPAFEDQLIQGNGMLFHGPSFASGPTIAAFKTSEIGAAPWEVQLQIQGTEPVTIRVGK